MHVGYSKFRYPDITGVWNLDYAHIQKILKEPSKIRSLGQENHTNHCLSLMKYFNPVSWKWCDQNIVEYCRLVSLKYVRPTVVITKPSRAIIGNPIESQKETWYEQMWEAEKISELKDEKYFRISEQHDCFWIRRIFLRNSRYLSRGCVREWQHWGSMFCGKRRQNENWKIAEVICAKPPSNRKWKEIEKRMNTESKRGDVTCAHCPPQIPPVFPKLSRSSNIRSTISTNEKQKFTLGWLASFYNVIYDCFIMLCDFF